MNKNEISADGTIPHTRTRSVSCTAEDPTRKRMTHLTTRLKDVFRISHLPPSSSYASTHKSVFPSAIPMQPRSISLPSSIRSVPSPSSSTSSKTSKSSSRSFSAGSTSTAATSNSALHTSYAQDQHITVPTQSAFSCITKPLPENIFLSYNVEDNNNASSSSDENGNATLMDVDEESKLTPSLIDSAYSSSLSEDDISNADNSENPPVRKHNDEAIIIVDDEDDDHFEYENETQWVDTSKHWYSDYIFPFRSKQSNQHGSSALMASSASSASLSQQQDHLKQSHEGILKTPNLQHLQQQGQNNNDTTNHHITTTTATITIDEANGNATILGKRPIPNQHQPIASSNSVIGPFCKKKKRIPVIRFDKMVQVHATYSQHDYNRQSDPDAICTRLNAMLAHQIKQELNLFKTTEMPIHEQSRIYTHFFF